MATIGNLKIYEAADAGKRVFRVEARHLLAVRTGLWRRGYTVKYNCNGSMCDLIIEPKGER